MEQLKLKVGRRTPKGFYTIVNVDGVEGEIFYEEVQTLKTAERLVKCWNEYDGLVNACKDVTNLACIGLICQILKNSEVDGAEGYVEVLKGLQRQCKEVLAKAKE